MKLPLAILIGLAGFTFAGTSSPTIAPTEPPVTETDGGSLWGWFIGGSAGYFFDTYEEEYYTAHLGVKLPSAEGGWATSIFLEGLYTKPEESYSLGYYGNFEESLEIIPVTLNVSFEKEIAGGLTFFIGGGVGAAFVDYKVSIGGNSGSIDDTTLAAQVFGGLGYNVTDNFQIYGAARWLYLDDTDIFDLEDDFGAELGLRLKF